MNNQLSKFEGSDIIKWAKELKHNEKVAKKYEGVTTVQDILKKAREDGYNFTEKELLDFNLDLVAGGAEGIGSGNTTGDINAKITGIDIKKQDQTQHQSQKTNENNLKLDAQVEGQNNMFNISNSNNANQY